jgi:hypothetical protein
MTKHRHLAPAGIWSRTTSSVGKALGKLWHGMITLPDRPTQRELEQDYPRFPFF